MDGGASSSSASGPPPAAQQAPPPFDVSHANALANEKNWTGLEKYITRVVADITGLKPEDVAQVHPDLFIIPRKEEMLKKMDNNQFEDAVGYFESSIKSLKDNDTEYRPFDLDLRIEQMAKLLRRRSLPAKRYSTEEVQIALSDYFRLYFAHAISSERSVAAVKSMWQFVMKIQDPHKAAQAPPDAAKGKRGKSRPGYRCLACQWVVDEDSQSITSMRYHFAHSTSRKACMRVTQHLINSLNAMSGRKVPDLVELRGRNKRKVSATAPASEEQATGGMDARAVFQKVKAAHDISQSLVNFLASDPSGGIDRDKLNDMVLEQEGILLELKSEILSAAPEAASSAPSNETDEEYEKLFCNLPDFNEVPIPEPEKWL
ncbi:hypothetical protein EJB05_39256 [Eragrostis curvula]|uniref:Uncharacterized protein n=1 Tax=Eragrostis curvula TaxID=38414 RepID=A0A5J9TXZ3_9POAL|nr:hypothetical protein EJB05_39256 [Eragrostis curvula]